MTYKIAAKHNSKDTNDINSNVVAVLRTSKFRRLCGEYIKAATPDTNSMAVITEERDRLSSLGLLDERSTELYNHAWQVSQVKIGK